MRAISLALLCICYLSSCTNTSTIPEGILPKQKMEAVLWDVVQIERYTTLYLTKDSTEKNPELQRFRLYDQVFNIHKVSRDEFIRSYKFYMKRPDLGKVIFDSISVRVQRQKEERYKSVPTR